MKFPFFRYYFLSVLLLAVLTCAAQPGVEVTADKTIISIGEPVKLTIRTTGTQVQEAAIPDSLQHFEILSKKPVETREAGGYHVTTQEVIITSFDSGKWLLPPIYAAGSQTVASKPIDFEVKNIADSTTTYGDLTQIINMQPPPAWPYWLGIGLLALLTAFLLYKLIRSLLRKKQQKANGELIALPDLLKRLEQLQEQWLQQKISSVQLGNGMMEVFRKFLLSKGIRSISKTGEEMITATQHLYDHQQWQGIAQTVRFCNAIRFGKYEPEKKEVPEAIGYFKYPIQTGKSDETYKPKAV